MSLLALQRDVRAWLAEESQDAAGRLGAAAKPGLEVYRNNYRASLTHCLSEAFERVRLWLGEERFLSTAAAHIDVTPPHAWTIDAYSRDFPATLAMLFPDDPEVFELGWLDVALADAFVGPDADPIDPAELGSINWDEARLRLAPTLATGLFRTNAAAIWSALSEEERPPAAAMLPEPVTILVWRRDLVSCFRTAEPGELYAIELARQGESFGAICGALIEDMGEEQGVAGAGALLARWISDGLLIAVE